MDNNNLLFANHLAYLSPSPQIFHQNVLSLALSFLFKRCSTKANLYKILISHSISREGHVHSLIIDEGHILIFNLATKSHNCKVAKLGNLNPNAWLPQLIYFAILDKRTLVTFNGAAYVYVLTNKPSSSCQGKSINQTGIIAADALLEKEISHKH